MQLLLFMPTVTLVRHNYPSLELLQKPPTSMLLTSPSGSLHCSSQSDPVKHKSEHMTTPFKPPTRKALQDWASSHLPNLIYYFPSGSFPVTLASLRSLNAWACSCLRAFAPALQECSSATYLPGKLLLLPLFKSHLLSNAVSLHFLKLQNPLQHSLFPFFALFSVAINTLYCCLSGLLFFCLHTPTPEWKLHERRDSQRCLLNKWM